MGTTLLRPTAALLDGELVHGATVTVGDDGTVLAIDAGARLAAATAAPDAEVELDGVLLPCPIDVQVNGAGGRSIDEGTRTALDTVARAVWQGGAGAFLPTLITAPLPRLLEQCDAVARWIDELAAKRCAIEGAATPLGIHLEGPFLETPGAHDANCFVDPTIDHLDALIAACRGHLALVTLAPGRAGAAAATTHLRAAGVAVSLGHARSVTGFGACVDAGARGVTHLFNAMSPLHHRDPGIVGHALDDARLACALILDGVHLDPIAARIAYRCLGRGRTILVTDAVAAAAMPDGDYELSGMRVTLRDGVVRDAAGHLAGSALTLAKAVHNFLTMIPGTSPADVAAVTAANPARLLGARGGSGKIALGSPARFGLLRGTRLEMWAPG